MFETFTREGEIKMTPLLGYKIRIKRSKDSDYDGPLVHTVEAEDIAFVEKIIREGYYQVSGKYRTVCKLPEGKTGIEALAEASGKPEWAALLGETGAGDQYLRCYALNRKPEDRLELSIGQWAAFKKLGGGSYRQSSDSRDREYKKKLKDILRVYPLKEMMGLLVGIFVEHNDSTSDREAYQAKLEAIVNILGEA